MIGESGLLLVDFILLIKWIILLPANVVKWCFRKLVAY